MLGAGGQRAVRDVQVGCTGGEGVVEPVDVGHAKTDCYEMQPILVCPRDGAVTSDYAGR
ncbi:hypothetical protein D3C71_1540260 [compost metagenome]